MTHSRQHLGHSPERSRRPTFRRGLAGSTILTRSSTALKNAVTSRSVTKSRPRAGADVVQLDGKSPTGAHEPARQLKSFAKVTLRPGQTRFVAIPIATSDLASRDNADPG